MSAASSEATAQGAAAVAGFAPDTADKLDMGVRSGLLTGLHGVIAFRNGATIVERYVSGFDWAWSKTLGVVEHGPSTLHDLRSASKSITSLLYGIALGEGKVAPPDAKLLNQFPALTDLAKDSRRASWTVQHVLDMVLGTEWNEDVSLSDARNSWVAMEQAKDWPRFILDRPIVIAPGARWNYNSGCTELLGALIAKGTGTPLEIYARDRLFAPLGITNFEWSKVIDGTPSASAGLRLTLRDLAKIGQLFLAKGHWQGHQIVSADWIDACSRPSVPTGDGRQYSRQWYLTEQPVPAAKGSRAFISAIGNGGQRLFIAPSLGLVVAMFAGNYNTPDQWLVPTLVLQKIILANIERV
jgi:CubicO group peptidase (beta-lactamase class C family)